MTPARLAPALVLTALVAAGTAAPALAGPLATPATTAFTIAGGGTRTPADGVPATAVRLHLMNVAGLPRGGALLVTVRDPQQPEKVRLPLWRLDSAGLLRAVPGAPEAATVAAAPDGSAGYAVPASGRATAGTRILRVDPSSGATTPAIDLAGRLKRVALLTALDDGALIASDGVTTLRVASDGAVTPAGPARRPSVPVASLLAQPGGAVLEVDTRGRMLRVAADGTVEAAPGAVKTPPLAALPDGTLVLPRSIGIDSDSETQLVDRLDLLGLDATVRPLVSGHPDLGDGDGGRPSGLRTSAGAAASTPEGGLLIADLSRRGDDPEYLSSAASLDGDRLRLLSPFGTTPPAAVALTPATYESWPRGRASILTGQPGQGVLTVTRPGSSRVVARASGALTGGFGELRLPRQLARGPYDLQLAFTGADGSRSIARLHVETTRVLAVARVRRLIDLDQSQRGEGDGGEGSDYRAGRCSRAGSRTVTCQILERFYGPSGHGTLCDGRETIRLAADGLHRSSRRRC